MYTKRNYKLIDMIRWTIKDTYIFIIIAIIPVILYDVFDIKWLHLPWLPIALIGTAVAFLVSFKNNASYDRLWEARKIWGGITNSSRSFAILVNDLITNENNPSVSDEELQTIKKTIINRHIAWMTAHRYALRQSKPWEFFLDNLRNKEFKMLYQIQELIIPFEEAMLPYLSESEFLKIKGKRNLPSLIISLQSNHLKALKNKDLIWEFSHLELEKLLIEFYTLQGKNERIKNFPYPRQFATLNLFIVWIFILLIPYGIMNEFDKIGHTLLEMNNSETSSFINQLHQFVASYFVWFTIPFSVMVSWIFQTMERVGEVSENPFEGTANDVPITTMSRDIEIDILEIIGENDVPEGIPVLYDIQM